MSDQLVPYKLVINHKGKKHLEYQHDRKNIKISKDDIKNYSKNKKNQHLKALLNYLLNKFGNSPKKMFKRALQENAYEVLPNYYCSSLTTFFRLFNKLRIKNIEKSLDSLLELSQSSKVYQSKIDTLNSSQIWQAYQDSYYAYHGNKDFKNSMIPLWLKDCPYYNSENGLLIIEQNLKAYIYEENENLTIAFAGTQVTSRIESVLADVIQLFGDSYVYVLSCGLIAMALKTKAYENVTVVGHSLGGGLTQFSVISNQSERLSGICFNSAGLSSYSLKALTPEKINFSKDKINHYTTKHDLVSKIGALIGHVVILPEVNDSLHGLNSIKPCLETYIKQ
jgi:hypothetical protein